MGINKKLLAGGANSRSTFTKCMYSMTDHKLKIKVSSCGKNFGCAWSDEKAGSVVATAKTLDEIIDETLSAVSSERTTRVIDNEAAGSMERRKREGYF